MIIVTSAYFRTNLGDMYRILATEDIVIKRHKEVVGVLIHPSRLEQEVYGEQKENGARDTAMRLTVIETLENLIRQLKEN